MAAGAWGNRVDGVCWPGGSGRCDARLGEAPKPAHTVYQSGSGYLTDSRVAEVEAEGLETPNFHCGNSTVFAERLRTGTGHTLVYDAPMREDGIQGLTCPFPSCRLSWQRGANALQLP